MSKYRVYNLFLIVPLLSLMACGRDGLNGNNGLQGSVGPRGLPGTPAASFYPVQLCPGTTHYPDTFCEVAFCYQGNFYGTYSANGGFSSEFPEGIYNSNGINCNCVITINSDCSVSI